MKKLRILLLLLVLISLSGFSISFAEDEPPVEDGWKRAKLKMSFYKSIKEQVTFKTPGYEPQKLFFADNHWLDDESERAKFKNFDVEVVGLPSNNLKHRGIMVKREGMSLKVDTNGDDKPDVTVAKNGTIVKVKMVYPVPERKANAALIFFMKLDEYSQKPHWTVASAYYWTAKIAGKPVYFMDNDIDGFLYVQTSDGLITDVKGIDGVKYGSYLSSVILLKNKLYRLKIDEQARWVDYSPYKGASAKADFISKFTGPVKPKFVVLRSYFKRDKPDPNAISIYLPKGKGLLPEASYEFKWTMLNEKCFGRDKARADQWYDGGKMPYLITKKGEKKYFPVLQARHDMEKKVEPWDVKNQIDITADMKKYVHVWGGPFGIHPKPYLETNDGGAKVDQMAFGVWDFLFYDSSGVCFFTPIEYKTDGAALPEEMMFKIIVNSPKTNKPITRNTRYTKGSGGGTGDADPNWALYKVALKGVRGLFKIEIYSKTKTFGVIEHFVDVTFAKEKK